MFIYSSLEYITSVFQNSAEPIQQNAFPHMNCFCLRYHPGSLFPHVLCFNFLQEKECMIIKLSLYYFLLRKHNGLYDNCDEDKDKRHVGYKKLQVEFAFFSIGSSRVHGRPQSLTLHS